MRFPVYQRWPTLHPVCIVIVIVEYLVVPSIQVLGSIDGIELFLSDHSSLLPWRRRFWPFHLDLSPGGAVGAEVEWVELRADGVPGAVLPAEHEEGVPHDGHAVGRPGEDLGILWGL